MSDHDHLDDLLRRAFDADRARMPPPATVDRVVSRIRRRERVRSLVVGGAALAGMVVGSLSAGPAIEALLTEAASLLPPGRANDHLGLMLLAAAGAASLLVLAPELDG